MRALLHYSLLKTRRNASLWVFMAVPAFLACSVVIGGSIASGVREIHYPFVMERSWSAERNARDVMNITTMFCVMFAALLAFSLLRSELATRSIDSMVLAVRPVKIAATIVTFATVAAAASWIVGLVVVTLLTSAVPSTLTVLVVKVLVGSLTTASLGALAVTISPEPPMIIGAYVATVGFAPAFEKLTITPILLAPIAASLIATAIATYLMERRCAR